MQLELSRDRKIDRVFQPFQQYIIPPSFGVRVGSGYKSNCVTNAVFGITLKICTVRYSNKKTNCIRLLLDNIHTLFNLITQPAGSI